MRQPNAQEFADRLRRDADEYHDGRIDHDELAARNNRTWRQIQTPDTSDEVHEILRSTLGQLALVACPRSQAVKQLSS
jgi:hypothetical protein